MSEFHELYERHYPDVYRFALFLTGDCSRAEDLAADTFVRAWVARDRIKLATVRAYLLTIAKNLYRDDCRRQRSTSALPDAVADPRPPVDVQVQHTLALDHVRARLRHVARGDRQAFLMFLARGMSHREIAGALGVSVGAVKSRIFRAREALMAHPRVRNGETT
jgi:RNA polymerase sigma-70 factor, ECF subfamily